MLASLTLRSIRLSECGVGSVVLLFTYCCKKIFPNCLSLHTRKLEKGALTSAHDLMHAR